MIGYWKIRYRDDETARSHPSHRRNLDCSGYYNPTTRTLFGDSEELIRQLDITLFDGSYSVPREPTRSPVETAQFNLKTLNNRLLSIVALRKIAHKDFVHECNQIPKDIKKIGEIVKLIRQFDSLINNFKVRIQSKKALLESMARRISTVSQPPE